MDFVPAYEFNQCVERYHGSYKVQNFSCWDHFLCMAFAQLTYRESLRDIESCLNAQRSKIVSSRFHGNITRSTLSYANNTRDWRIYATSHRCWLRSQKIYIVVNSSLLIFQKRSTHLIRQRLIYVCPSFHGPDLERKSSHQASHAVRSAREYSVDFGHFWR